MKSCILIFLVCIAQYCVAQYCRNKANAAQCRNWVVKGFCTSSTYDVWMRKNCALSCGNCNCKDGHKSCVYWAGKGECKTNPNYMLPTCQRSCAVCRSPTTKKPITKPKPKPTAKVTPKPNTKPTTGCRKTQNTQCPNWAISGLCTSSKWSSYMKTNCPVSCGYCNCKDLNWLKDGHINCSNWARKGECKKNPKYMLPNCQRSCAVCRRPTTKKPITKPKPKPTPKSTTVPSAKSDNIKCGTRALLGRVVGGSYAQARAWPWQIGIKSCAKCTYFCGGTIVAKKWVITAAHCVLYYLASDLYIDAGITNQGNITKHKQSFRCTAIHSHQSYAINAPYDEDIAVLQLNKEVDFNDHVRPLCLNKNKLKAPQKCTVTGFGRTSAQGPKSAKLKQANVPIVVQDVCVKSYNQTKPPRRVTKNMVCAGYPNGGTDACGGDSGGPLTCWDQNKQHYVLGGIVSWGVGCARANHYGVYTDVKHLTSWITRITGKIQ